MLSLNFVVKGLCFSDLPRSFYAATDVSGKYTSSFFRREGSSWPPKR